MLIIFSGLPGTGKSSIAQKLARDLGAVWLRIDSIEQGIRESGIASSSVDDAATARPMLSHRIICVSGCQSLLIL